LKRQPKYVSPNTDARLCNHSWRGKAICITYSEYMFVWSLRYPARKARVSYCHLCYVRLYNVFAHYLIKWRDFQKKKLLKRKCVLIFSTTFAWNISHSRNRARYDQTIHRSLCQVPEFAGSNPAEVVGFFGHPKNPPHVFLRR
jgi:hypothetical protein